ncbi:MAG: DUF3604 domain-containing protein [Candidatus Zixiibacteriota bacterium]
MPRSIPALICISFVLATGTGAAEDKPWVKVKPDVLTAGSVVREIKFEVKMPVDAPVGSAVEIEIPYHFGFPQTENADADNYFTGKPPRGVEFDLEAEEASARSYFIRAVVKSGKLKRGKKFKLLLKREHTHPFNQDEKALLTYVKGPRAEGEDEGPVLAEGRTTVIHIPGGPPARFRVVAPTCVTPGEPFAVKAAVLDENNNPPPKPWKGDVTLAGDGVSGPAAASLTKKDANYLEVEGFTVAEPGVYRVEVRGGGLSGRSNPIVCRENWDRRIYWCDEQGHSAFSDGMRQPDEYFDYGRYVALLDDVLLTDHAENIYEDEWPTFVEIANAKNDPPAFVTLVAYEWTSDAWSGGYGHRCVFYRGDGGPYYSSFVEDTDTPLKLWSKYRPGEVVMIPHHTLAGFRWSSFDPAFDRCVEIVSHWGSSEYEGNSLWTNQVWRGGDVVSALDSYYILGFVGGGDNHNGAPGQNHGPSRMRHMPYYGGITACLMEENTRPGVFDALYERRVYATSGNRDFLDFTVNDAPMASVIPVKDEPIIEGEAATEGRLKSIEVIRGGETVLDVMNVGGSPHVEFYWRDYWYDGEPTYYYVRVTSEDGHVAFATPIWVARGEWLALDESGEDLAPGERLPLPAPLNAEFDDYAVRVKATAAEAGRIKVTSGDEVVAAAETAPGEREVTLNFEADPEEWNVALTYDGATALNVAEACVYPYPWLEPSWVGRWWTWQAEDEEHMSHIGNVVDDAGASEGSALAVSLADGVEADAVLWGPYQTLERGEYQAHFYLRAEGDPGYTKPAATISVATASIEEGSIPSTTASKTISAGTLAGSPGYQKFTLDFTLTEKTKCEYKVKYHGGAIVYVDKVDVQQTAYE